MITRKIKMMPVDEFRREGYLQEVNRRFLHPLGLSLMVDTDKDGIEEFAGVLDDRHDLEGVVFAYDKPEFHTEEEMDEWRRKRDAVMGEVEKRRDIRIEAVGSWIEEIPSKKNNKGGSEQDSSLCPECGSVLEIRRLSVAGEYVAIRGTALVCSDKQCGYWRIQPSEMVKTK